MDALGKRYADSRPLDIRALTEEANKFTPAIFILSTGADPTNAINELARKMKKKVGSISMGQGQEPAARKLLQQGMLVGSWVLLQNCHLGLKMMRELETTIIWPGLRGDGARGDERRAALDDRLLHVRECLVRP